MPVHTRVRAGSFKSNTAFFRATHFGGGGGGVGVYEATSFLMDRELGPRGPLQVCETIFNCGEADRSSNRKWYSFFLASVRFSHKSSNKGQISEKLPLPFS